MPLVSPLPLGADPDTEARRLLQRHARLRAQQHAMLKVDVVAANGDDSFVFPDPATYLVGPDGVIAWSVVPNNYRRRAEVNHIIEAVRALRARA